MGFFSSKSFGSLEDLFVEQIEDLYDAEIRLTKALPKMAEASQLEDLKKAFEDHLRETEVHIDRLERVFAQMGREPKREPCEGIKGLISEGNEMVSADGDLGARDAGLIAAAQRVEHYEMAGYGTARAMAEFLGDKEVAKLLQSTLDEEMSADKKLTDIAEGSIYGKRAKSESDSSNGAEGAKGRRKVARQSKSSNGHSNGHRKTAKAKSSRKGSGAKAKGRKRATAKR